jgi:hypothetical protein
VGTVIFGILTISKSGRLPLHIVICVEEVMVVLLMLCSTLLWHNSWKEERQRFNIFIKVYTDSWVILAIFALQRTANEQKITHVCPTFCFTHATVANFIMHAGKKSNTQNEECMNIGISTILPVYLPIHHVQ